MAGTCIVGDTDDLLHRGLCIVWKDEEPGECSRSAPVKGNLGQRHLEVRTNGIVGSPFRASRNL